MTRDKIGIMDSGIGGLTVEKEIAKIFPGNDLVYIGDTARVPYGTRTPQTIKQFALELLEILLSKKVSVVVVACNTISAVCLDFLKSKSPVPVIGVIDPTIEEVKKTKLKKIGIIGTKATIGSGIYTKKLPEISTVSVACPLFVPLVEENFIDHPATDLVISTYLSGLKNNIDGLILGCTHFPYLREKLEKFFGPIKFFDSGTVTAIALKSIISPAKGKKGKRDYIFTDGVQR